jgi:hypothetical protein
MYVKANVFIGVFALQEEKLRDYQVGYLVVDRHAQENDAFLKQQ